MQVGQNLLAVDLDKMASRKSESGLRRVDANAIGGFFLDGIDFGKFELKSRVAAVFIMPNVGVDVALQVDSVARSQKFGPAINHTVD